MIDKAQHLAQALGDRLSRRNFLGRVGRGAALAALACGSLLAVPDDVHAGRPCTDKDGKVRACPKGQECVNGRCQRPRVKR